MSLKKSTPLPLKVGFDLDGVILYNPARVVRPLIAFVKHLVRGRQPKTHFRIPTQPWEKAILTFLHKSSIFIAPGYTDIQKLVKAGQIEAYLITGRYSFLKKDFETWLRKMNAATIFKAIHLNEHDDQPHLYKENLIKKYQLDVFVDDNWDIIKHLHQGKTNKQHQAQPLWVYNLFDRQIAYAHKYPDLKQVMHYIKTHLLPQSK